MTKEEKVQHWIDLADRDFSTAEYLINGGHNLYVGYLCHQAIEKIFKAYYAKIKEETPPFTHDLEGLAEKTGLFDVMNEEQKNFIETLNPLNIEARYPQYKSKIAQILTNEITQNILDNTKEILQWTKQKIF